MVNPLCILARSAVPEQTKVATAVAEILRRWKTTSCQLGTQAFEDITRTYMDNLCAMGYGQAWREMVLQSALTGYQRVLHQVKEGTTRSNRSGASTSRQRRFNRVCGAANWYKVAEDPEEESDGIAHGAWERIKPRRGGKGKNEKGKYLESILFIPYTPRSTLKQRVAKLENSLPFKTR